MIFSIELKRKKNYRKTQSQKIGYVEKTFDLSTSNFSDKFDGGFRVNR